MAIANKPQWLLAAAGWVLALGLLFLVWRTFERLQSGSGAPVSQGADSASAADPVSGEKLAKGDPNVRALYQGREYWFTSKENKLKFLADPERFLGGKSIMAGLSPTAGVSATQVPTATLLPTAVPVTVEPRPAPAAKAGAISAHGPAPSSKTAK